jgi:hypothetical protein
LLLLAFFVVDIVLLAFWLSPSIRLYEADIDDEEEVEDDDEFEERVDDVDDEEDDDDDEDDADDDDEDEDEAVSSLFNASLNESLGFDLESECEND